MEQTEALKKKIASAQGLQIVLKDHPETVANVTRNPLEDEEFGAVVFGSQQGMCGQFNEEIAGYAVKFMADHDIHQERRRILVLGERVVSALEEADQPIHEHVPFFSASGKMGGLMQQVLNHLETWRRDYAIGQLTLFFNTLRSGASSHPTHVHLLPLDIDWLRGLERQPWDSTSLPWYTLPTDQLFSALLRQYVFVSLYRAVVGSLASENASRLAAMQAASQNIEDYLDELNNQYQRQRQNGITMELLDIVSGFEALAGSQA